MKRLLRRNLNVNGLFCFNDAIAIGAMTTAFESGRRIPEDLAVIGCGNLHYNDSLRVPLTSIDQASSSMGKRAAGLLIDLFNAEAPTAKRHIVISPHLVVRDSTRKVPPGQDILEPVLLAGAESSRVIAPSEKKQLHSVSSKAHCKA